MQHKGFPIALVLKPLCCKPCGVLDDGTYEGVIVDAAECEPDDGTISVELAISTGPRKGYVVTVRGRFPDRTAIDVLALPATLNVTAGEPHIHLQEGA